MKINKKLLEMAGIIMPKIKLSENRTTSQDIEDKFDILEVEIDVLYDKALSCIVWAEEWEVHLEIPIQTSYERADHDVGLVGSVEIDDVQYTSYEILKVDSYDKTVPKKQVIQVFKKFWKEWAPIINWYDWGIYDVYFGNMDEYEYYEQ